MFFAFSGIRTQIGLVSGQAPWGRCAANTRGLVELVVLNIGLDLGVISPTLFTMLVIMALVTTFMTSPLMQFLLRKHPWVPEVRVTAA